jgi:hypothetical protein
MFRNINLLIKFINATIDLSDIAGRRQFAFSNGVAALPVSLEPVTIYESND